MKKIILIVISILCFSACTAVRIDTKDIDNIIAVVLSKDNNLYNRLGKGYKYYLPRGFLHIDVTENNSKIINENIIYYLNIDVFSFLKKTENDYHLNKDAYYSKIINNKGYQGYLEITPKGKNYYIVFSYNYATIETIVPKDKINTAILNSTYILSSVKYNTNLIKMMNESDYFNEKEIKYEKFKIQNKNDDSFIKVVEEAVVEEKRRD